jgi:phospholipase/carboxylesterase
MIRVIFLLCIFLIVSGFCLNSAWQVSVNSSHTANSLCSNGVAVAIRQKDRESMITDRNIYDKGRLTARPDNKATKDSFTTGIQSLGLDGKKDGLMYVPKSYHHDRPAALAVMLHGAGGNAEQGMSLLKQYADDNNIILIAPASRAGTWDIIVNESFGPDVIFMDQALALAFKRYNIDTSRIAIGGFSDGASYALCIGLTNGDLFSDIIAFSPGFAYTVEPTGKPAVFISHGIKDRVLPIDPCSRRVVPQLKRHGLEVNYIEFDGAHEIPGNISKSAVEGFTK